MVPSTNSWKSDLVVDSTVGVVSPRLARSKGSMGFRSSGSLTPPGVSTGTPPIGRRVRSGAPGRVGSGCCGRRVGNLGGRRDDCGGGAGLGGLLHVILGGTLLGGWGSGRGGWGLRDKLALKKIFGAF